MCGPKVLFPLCLMICLLCLLMERASADCTDWQRPNVNSRSFVYSDDHYGQLGIKYGFTSALIIPSSGCYDVSNIGFSQLDFLFNNKVPESSKDTNYLGVLAVRTYARNIGNTKPIKAAFFRNGSELDATSDWAVPSTSVHDFKTESVVSGSQVLVQKGPYEPIDDTEVDKITDLAEMLTHFKSVTDSAARTLIDNWHALIVSPAGAANEFTVIQNTEKSANLWSLDPTLIKIPLDGVTIARSYLIKFKDSTSPSQQIFFTIEGLSGAKCVYLKTIDPRREVPLGISQQSGNLIVLKLDTAASC
jgi:hypothetical protein